MKNKLKTKKAVVKRFKITKTGKILRSHQLRTNHLRRKKSKGAKRRYSKLQTVKRSDLKAVKRMLGI